MLLGGEGEYDWSTATDYDNDTTAVDWTDGDVRDLTGTSLFV